MTLGEKIKQARLDRGMTQRDVVGDYITRNMLSKIENGSATPSIKTLEYLAEALGLPPAFFMNDLPPENAASGVDGARAAYRRGDYARAIELVGATLTDEAMLLCLKCCAALARAAFSGGDLSAARAFAREGLKHADGGIYTDHESEAECCQILMQYALRSPQARAGDYDRYAARLEKVMDLGGLGQRAPLIAALRSGTASELSPDELTDHWALAVWHLIQGREAAAVGDMSLLHEAENEAELHGGRLLLGDVYAALEQAYSAHDDYKNAYIYATKRLEIQNSQKEG